MKKNSFLLIFLATFGFSVWAYGVKPEEERDPEEKKPLFPPAANFSISQAVHNERPFIVAEKEGGQFFTWMFPKTPIFDLFKQDEEENSEDIESYSLRLEEIELKKEPPSDFDRASDGEAIKDCLITEVFERGKQWEQMSGPFEPVSEPSHEDGDSSATPAAQSPGNVCICRWKYYVTYSPNAESPYLFLECVSIHSNVLFSCKGKDYLLRLKTYALLKIKSG